MVIWIEREESFHKFQPPRADLMIGSKGQDHRVRLYILDKLRNSSKMYSAI